MALERLSTSFDHSPQVCLPSASSYETAEELAEKIQDLIIRDRPKLELDPFVQKDKELHRSLTIILIKEFGQVGRIVATYARALAINVKLSKNKKSIEPYLPVRNYWEEVPRNCLGLLFDLSAGKGYNSHFMKNNCQYLLEQGVEINDEPVRSNVYLRKCDLRRNPSMKPKAGFKPAFAQMRDDIILPYVLKHKIDVSPLNKKAPS